MRRARPSKYVLFRSKTWRAFYVSKKSPNTTLREYELLDHFVSFFTTKVEALEYAVTMQTREVNMEKQKLVELKRYLRQAKKEGV